MGCVLHLSYSMSTHLQPPVFYPMPGRKHRPTAQIVHLCVSVYLSVYVCLCVCVSGVCVCLYVCVCLSVCISLCLSVSVCVTCRHAETHRHTHMLISSFLLFFETEPLTQPRTRQFHETAYPASWGILLSLSHKDRDHRLTLLQLLFSTGAG